MTKSYIFATLSEEFAGRPTVSEYVVPMKAFLAPSETTPAPNVGDQALLVPGRNGAYESVEEYIPQST